MRVPTACALLVALTSAACVDDDPDLGASEHAASVLDWTDDVAISGHTSPYQVGLAPFADRLQLVYTKSSTGELVATRFDGRTWASGLALAQYADYGPALVEHDGRLVLVYHRKGQNRLLMSTSTSPGSAWSSPITAGSAIGSDTVRYAPAAANLNGILTIMYCRRTASGDRVQLEHLSVRDGVTWLVDASVPVTGTCKHVALWHDPGTGRNHYVVNVEQASGTWDLSGQINAGNPWLATTWTWFDSMRSKKPVSMVTCGATTHLVHGGYSTPNEIWWAARDPDASASDVRGWTEDLRVPAQASHGGAALGCYQGTRAIMVHNGGTDQLWWAEYFE